MRKALAISSAALVVAALLGGYALTKLMQNSSDPFQECRQSQIAGGAIGGAFSLLNGKGELVTDKDVITKPTLVYFGYSFCPDICPFDNARNGEAVALAKEQDVDLGQIMITIDPARDTPEVVDQYVKYFNPNAIGLSGEQAQIDQAVKAYKAYGAKPAGEPETDYIMDHSTFTYLVYPGGLVEDFFRRETTAQDIANTVSCYSRKGR